MTARVLAVGGGRLSVGPKPKPKAFGGAMSPSHVITLIQATEGAAQLGAALCEKGVEWKHFPFTTKNLRAVDSEEMLDSFLWAMDVLASGQYLHIHCLEGLHRTGMFTYGLLRMMGCDQFDAMDVLSMLRPESARALTTPLREWTEATIKRGFRLGWSGSLKS